MSDERRASVCGDPVEPAVADEPGVPGDDLHPHETSVEDHEGDEGPEAGPAPDADPAATILPGVPDVTEDKSIIRAPCVIMSISTSRDSHIDLSMVCERCGLVTVLQARTSDKDDLVNYHLTHETINGENGEKFIMQMLLRCYLSKATRSTIISVPCRR